MTAVALPEGYGYVVAVAVLFWIQQSVFFVIPVAMQRKATGIEPPVLYPNDDLVKTLKLSPEKVNAYLRTQRVHQNNVEFLTVFFPMLLLAGFQDPLMTAKAGFVCWLGRFATALGYWIDAKKRVYGAWFHIPELYIVYLAGKLAYAMITN